MRFSQTTTLITGAASGIGLATAELIASEGSERLILIDLDGRALDAVELPCAVERLTGDISDPDFWESTAFGSIDHAVVNAGIAGAASITDLTFDDWRRILSVNLDGAFLTLRATLRSIKDGGSIVTVASAAGLKPEPGIAAYGASKAGLIQLSRIAAKESAARNVRINAIAPGGVETPVWDQVPMFADRAAEVGREAAFTELAEMATPLGRYAKPNEIAEQIAFLLSASAASITGSVLVSDGGYTL